MGMGVNPRDPLQESGSALENVAQWVQQQNANLTHDRPFSPSSSNPPFRQQEMVCNRPNERLNQMVQQWGPSSPGPPMNDALRQGHPPGYPIGGPHGGGGFGPEMHMSQNLMHNKVSSENLTPEQLQRREDRLARVRQIGQMLLEPQQQRGMDGGPGGPIMQGPGPDGEMWPPHMMPHSGMGPPRPGMIGSPNGPPGMNFPGGPGFPPNFENMTPAQQDWHRLQQEHYMEKVRMQKMQQMQMTHGGPPGYFNPGQGHNRMPGPMSPLSPNHPAMMQPQYYSPPGSEQFFLPKQNEFGPMYFFPEQGFDRGGHSSRWDVSIRRRTNASTRENATW